MNTGSKSPSAELEVWREISGVRVWRFSLDCDAVTVGKYRQLLSSEELQRADRLVTEQLQSRFVVARATTRAILAGEMGYTDPAKLKFTYGSHGKPSVINGPQFNLTHSHNLALLALSGIGEVGVDVEWISRDVEVKDIAERFFTPEECSEMMSKSGNARTEHFFDLWCCKEAYLKAVGVGISGGLNRCRIVNAVDGTASVHNATDHDSASRWRIHHLEPGVGFAGAVCIDSIGGSLI